MLANAIANFFLLVVTDLMMTIGVKKTLKMLSWICFGQCGLIMTISWDDLWCYHCGTWDSHICDVTDVIVIVNME